jgi:hypothetical protein
MRRSSIILAVFLIGNLAHQSQAVEFGSPAKTPSPVAVRALAAPQPLPVRMIEENRATRGQIAACANLAALRGMSARTSGSDYATQNRVLELTFLMCMSGTPVRD